MKLNKEQAKLVRKLDKLDISLDRCAAQRQAFHAALARLAERRASLTCEKMDAIRDLAKLGTFRKVRK